MRDVILKNRGQIILLVLVSRVAHEWAEKWLDVPSPSPNTITIPATYAEAVAEGMRDDGLSLRGEIHS